METTKSGGLAAAFCRAERRGMEQWRTSMTTAMKEMTTTATMTSTAANNNNKNDDDDVGDDGNCRQD